MTDNSVGPEYCEQCLKPWADCEGHDFPGKVVEGFPYVGTCSVCEQPQFETPSGRVCSQGHGGAPSDTIHPVFNFEKWWSSRGTILATQHPNFHDAAQAAYAEGFRAGSKK